MSRYFSCVQCLTCSCSAACVKIILMRKGFQVDELEVAKGLGVRVTQKESSKCKELMVSDSDAGLNLEEFESKKVQKYLSTYGLKAKVYKFSKIKNLESFIVEKLKEDSDVIVNFHHKPFKNGKNGGHYVLVDEIKEGQVVICDPAIDAPKYWQTSLDLLKIAMDTGCDGKERGIVVISEL